jgi:hypothetical protein
MLKAQTTKLSKIINIFGGATKPKINIEQFCERHYDSYFFFNAENYLKDKLKSFGRGIIDSIAKVDYTFQNIDLDIFTCELTALHIELFGLAWMHHFRLEKYSGLEEKYTFGEIVFTKNYLEQNGYDNIWKIMSYYNNTIADALLHPCISAIDRAFSPPVAINDEIPCYFIDRKFLKNLRSNNCSWEKEIGIDCATRLINRASKRENWGGCPISLLLIKKFAERLDWKVDLGHAGFAGFESLLNRLYNDFKQEIESIEIEY